MEAENFDKTRKANVKNLMKQFFSSNKSQSHSFLNESKAMHEFLTAEEFMQKKIESILREFFVYNEKDDSEDGNLSKIENLNMSYLTEYVAENGVEMLQDAFYQLSPPYLSLYLMKGKITLVREMQSRFAVDFQDDKNNRNALHYAAMGVSGAAVEFLLKERKFNINSQDDFGCTALIYAAYQGNLDIVRKLIEHGANVNLSDKRKKTPLHYAVSSNDFDIVSFLIETGAETNMQDESGSTPLIYAAHNSNLPIVRALIIKGRARTNIVNHELINIAGLKCGFTAIDYSTGEMKKFFKKRECKESSLMVKSIVSLKGVLGGAFLGAMLGLVGLVLVSTIALILSILSIPVIFLQKIHLDPLSVTSFLLGSAWAVIGGIAMLGASLGPVWSNITHFKFNRAQLSVLEIGEIFECEHSRILLKSVKEVNFKRISESLPKNLIACELAKLAGAEKESLNEFIEKEFRSIDGQ